MLRNTPSELLTVLPIAPHHRSSSPSNHSTHISCAAKRLNPLVFT